MAESTQGITGYLFGIGATSPTGATLQNLRVQISDALESEIKDENGKVITVRTDDQRDDITATMKIKASGFTRPAIGAALVVAGSTLAGSYMIKTTSEALINDDWAEFEISAVKREYVTLV